METATIQKQQVQRSTIIPL